MDYRIEKPGVDYRGLYGWGLAWGFKKSFLEAPSDEEAISAFKERTAKCRTAYRLVSFSGFGYNPTKKVVFRNEHPAKKLSLAEGCTDHLPPIFPCDNEG